MAAVREAIAGAQQNALADKAARKRAMQQHAHSTSISSSDPVTAPTTAVASDEMSSTTPVQKQRPPNRRIRTRSNSPESHRDHCRLVDTAVQTEQPFKQLCHCGNKSRSRQDVRYAYRFGYPHSYKVTSTGSYSGTGFMPNDDLIATVDCTVFEYPPLLVKEPTVARLLKCQ